MVFNRRLSGRHTISHGAHRGHNGRDGFMPSTIDGVNPSLPKEGREEAMVLVH